MGKVRRSDNVSARLVELGWPMRTAAPCVFFWKIILSNVRSFKYFTIYSIGIVAGVAITLYVTLGWFGDSIEKFVNADCLLHHERPWACGLPK